MKLLIYSLFAILLFVSSYFFVTDIDSFVDNFTLAILGFFLAVALVGLCHSLYQIIQHIKNNQ